MTEFTKVTKAEINQDVERCNCPGCTVTAKTPDTVDEGDILMMVIAILTTYDVPGTLIMEHGLSIALSTDINRSANKEDREEALKRRVVKAAEDADKRAAAVGGTPNPRSKWKH